MPQASTDRQGAPPFVHLHLHTEYSLLDGANRIDRLIARVKELGMTAVAITDHGNLFGAMAFYDAARTAGVKPILGVEAYVAQGSRRDRTYTGAIDGGYHLVLLAENETGWRNLLHLCSEAYLTGFYYKPRVDRELLESHHSGLIAICGHLGSELAYPLADYVRTGDESHYEKARRVAEWHARVFADEGTGPRFFIELQSHAPEQDAINPSLLRLARELSLSVVATNDAHFLRAEDHDAHDTLVCISMGKNKESADRLRYPPQVYVKSAAEMAAQFRSTLGDAEDAWRGAMENSARIAERCNLDLEFTSHAPLVKVERPASPRAFDPAMDPAEWFRAFCADYRLEPVDTGAGAAREDLIAECDRALRELAEAGFLWRYGPDGDTDAEAERVFERSLGSHPVSPEASKTQPRRQELRARLNRELAILAQKHISPYFLIVWDFVSWARRQGIPALARGSGVGTMVGYCLGLSNACPVRYGLLFERFTDPDRSEYPDIDIDLCQDGRAAVIDYVRRKYGHVAQIITFGTLKARAAVRDVGRVFGMPLTEVDRLAKLIPEQLHMTLDTALVQEPALREAYDADPRVRRVIDTARTLEGQARHASIHAAGVIVATRPLREIVPLYKQSGSEDVVTQWDGPTCERVGLLKMDFLGLRTLSTIERAKQLIRETLPEAAIANRPPAVGGGGGDSRLATGDPLDLDRLTFDDPNVFALFQRADTAGVFQFESAGMRRLLVEMKPDRLEDLIAANALYRPGPMDLITTYNRRKHGKEAVPKVHPIVDGFTAETYGVMVYQEQVMQIVHGLGGIPLRAAYSLIKAISKKKTKEIEKNRALFLEGAQRQGVSKRQADELFEMILKFAGYGFNKSHSTAYAIIAYQTAWLKTYFPNQYMAAFLTYESKAQKVEDWIRYKDDCRHTRFPGGKVGVDIRPPDINLSDVDFTVVFDEGEPRDADHGHVRFGLSALKGAGDKAVRAIVEERKRGGAFRSLFDFCERVAVGTLTKATIEALVACGAFDSVHGREARASMIASIDAAVNAGQAAARDRAVGQAALFGEAALETPSARRAEPPLARVKAWDTATMLAREREVLGFYVSSHPLDQHAALIEGLATASLAEARSMGSGAKVVLAGIVKSVRTMQTKNGRAAGQPMGVIKVEDKSGVIDAVLFAETFSKYAATVSPDSVMFLTGRVDHARGEPQVIVERVVPVDEAPLQLASRVEVEIQADAGDAADAALSLLMEVLRSPPPGERGAATVPVILRIHCRGRRVALALPTPVPLSAALLEGLKGAAGPDAVRLLGGRPKAARASSGDVREHAGRPRGVVRA